MIVFRAFLVLIIVSVGAYTGVVISRHGLDLFSVFFGDMAQLAWPGQFNLDFMCMLALSGVWVAYRHRFSALGLALGVCGFFAGAPILSAYLLVESFRTKGDVSSLLLGENRAAP